MPEPPIMPSTAFDMLTPSSRQRSYASFETDLECHENGRLPSSGRARTPDPGVTSRMSGRLPQLACDQALQRFDRLEVFRRDLVLRDGEVEFSFNAEHQVDHVHRG